jgi:hypothetical protein
MKLSLSEAATALGKSERQLRYLIKTGRLSASKEGGRWSIDSDDLPLTEAQRAAIAAKVDTARAAFEKGLEPAEKATGDAEKRYYSVTDLQAFQSGEAIYRGLKAELGLEDVACRHLFDALALLTRGCHAFQPVEKAARFTEAREAAADAAAHLLLHGDAPDEQRRGYAQRIEQELIPKIGSLVVTQEKRSRQGRFDRFGSTLTGARRAR